ncbi:MAG: hypothetical protein JW917_10730 [Ignavibacteria bacterium]|nr:hypothetical protein [Ignavibacteria bacterium]
MKKSGLIFLVLVFAVNASPQSGMPEARNVFYLSFGFVPFGPVSVGVNYERMVSPNASIKVGVNYSYLFAPNPDFPADAYISVPVMVNYLTSNNNKFEIGLGGGPIFRVSEGKNNMFPLQPAFGIAYRYQLTGKSMVYKMGIEMPAAPAFNLYGIGYHF